MQDFVELKQWFITGLPLFLAAALLLTACGGPAPVVEPANPSPSPARGQATSPPTPSTEPPPAASPTTSSPVTPTSGPDSEPTTQLEPPSTGGAIVGPTSVPSVIDLRTVVPTTVPSSTPVVSTPNPQATPLPQDVSAYPQYGHDPNWAWVAGLYRVTGIQGGCRYLAFDPSPDAATTAPYGGSLNVTGDLDAVKSDSLVVVFGHWQTGPREMCPGQQYVVTKVLTR
jgi:hypothetical protein